MRARALLTALLLYGTTGSAVALAESRQCDRSGVAQSMEPLPFRDGPAQP